MPILAMRFALGVLFLLLGTLILTHRWLMPGMFAGYDTLRLNLGGVLALVFGGLNLARWYAAWSFQQITRTAVRYPLQRDPSAAPQVERVPEFDFFKQQPEDQTEGEKDGEGKPETTK